MIPSIWLVMICLSNARIRSIRIRALSLYLFTDLKEDEL